MKKNRLTALILTFVLLFGCLSVLPVFAEEAAEDGQVKIHAQNLIFDEKVQIVYAVECTDEQVKDGTVKFACYIDGEEVETEYLGPQAINSDENAIYPVFAIKEGFHANDFTKVVEAVAYTGEEVPADATYKTYSVGQYFYSRLYKDGIVSATEGKNADRKALYEAAIAYGTNAQKVLDDTTGNDLLDKYCFLWTDSVDGADTTVNGEKTAFVKADTVVTLGGAAEYSMEKIVNGEGTGTIADNAYTAEAGVVAKVTGTGAVVVDPEPEEPKDKITVMDYESGLPYSNYVATYDANDARVENTSWPANNPTNSYASLDADPKNAANHVLHVRVPANKTNIYTKVELSNTVQTGNYYTFETKMYSYALSSGTAYANIQFINSADKASLDIDVKALSVPDVANNAIALYATGSNYGSGKADETIFFDAKDQAITATKWFTLRFEYYYAGGDSVSGADAIAEAQQGCVLKIYVNDVLAYEGNEYWQVTKDIKYVKITTEATGVAKNIAFDDISFTRTAEAYVPGN